MERETPERLLHERFMPLDTPFRLFRHQLVWLVPVHWHEFFEIALVTSGTGIHIFNGQKMPLRKGCLFLSTPADFHEIIPSPGETLRLYNAIFVQRFIRPELLQWVHQAGQGIAVELDEASCAEAEREFEVMWEESEHPRRGGDWVIAGALERTLVMLMRQFRGGRKEVAESRSSAIHPAISEAITYISYQFHEPLTLETVARHVGLSANYFSERFSKATDVPFQRYLQDLRLQYAHSMLRMTQLPITEVCYASGFGNLSHFERAFKSKFGRTPRQARSDGTASG